MRITKTEKKNASQCMPEKSEKGWESGNAETSSYVITQCCHVLRMSVVNIKKKNG